MSLLNRISLEDVKIDTDGIDTSDVLPVTTVDIDTDITGLANDSDTLAELNRDAVLVEHIGVSMQQDQEHLSTESLRIYSMTLESIRKKLGVEGPSVVPSLENFDEQHERKASFHIAQEGIMDVMKNIWRAIVKFFRDMWGKIKNFFHNLFGYLPRLHRRLEILEKSVDKVVGTPSERDFKDEELSSAFTIRRSLQYGEVLTILDGYQQVNAGSKEISQAVREKLQNVKAGTDSAYTLFDLAIETVEKLFKITESRNYEDIPEKDRASVDPLVSKITAASEASKLGNVDLKAIIFRILSMTEKAHTSKDIVGVSSIPLLNEDKIVMAEDYAHDQEDDSEKILLLKINSEEDREISKTVSVLTPNQMKAVTAKVKSILKSADSLTETSKLMDDLSVKLISVSEKMAEIHEMVAKANLPGEFNITSQYHVFSKQVRIATRTISGIMNTLITTMPKDFLKVSSMSLDYVEKSLSYY